MDKSFFKEAVYAYLGGKELPPNQWENAFKTTRQKISFRIYKEKAADANPYYFSSSIMHRCLSAAWEIINSSEEKLPSKEEAEILSLSQCGKDDTLYRDFSFFISHDIYTIMRIAGGHRSSIINDTEIDISVLLLSGRSKEDFMKKLLKVSSDFNVRFIEL
ncbi:hypothetical protein [Anaeropeptidivorans aminofermentans]|uniref:hypothetical protein n=1 Tax=Anaeropeptidivorans aminofermentans TaxID=2934315 RepID=UPI002023C2E0|nr:hypothetical protein [Anaeropeptidivorans aminofermentans]